MINARILLEMFTEDVEIHVHKYGAYIFHTNNKKYGIILLVLQSLTVSQTAQFANYHGELYSLPFNMYTFNKMWEVALGRSSNQD